MSIEVKCSKGLRDFVLKNIYSSRKITIVSPWISEETAKILIDLTSLGVEVGLITTNDPLPSHVKGLSMLINVERRVKKSGRPRLAVLGVLLFVIGIPLLILPPVGLPILSFGLFLYLKYKPVYEELYYSRLKELLVTSSKLHAKLILTENAIGLGSLNFTEAGLTSNIECFIWITDQSIYNKIVEDINTLKNMLQKEVIDYRLVYIMSRQMRRSKRR
jgi:predicted transcriptional regulator